MNAQPVKTMLALSLAAATLGGCAAAFDPATDASSPIAPRVQALVDAHRTYPRWEDFPKAATDTPQPIEVAARVNTLRVTAGALAGEAARIDWTLGDPATLAAEINSRVDAQQISPVTAETQAEVEAFAAAARRRGAAPPPIDRPR